VIDQVRGAFGHATAAARRAESTTLARKRHQAIQYAGVAVEPREPGRETPASEKFADLLLDKPWQAFTISNRRHLRTERLEVFEDGAREGPGQATCHATSPRIWPEFVNRMRGDRSSCSSMITCDRNF
jgi:hypothetical protein